MFASGRSAALLDRMAVAVLVVCATLVALTFRDFGLGWDDFTHSEYGALLVSLYSSGFEDKRALSFVNLYYYGGGFDLISALTAKILPFDLFETRRLVGGALGVLGIFATWRLGRRLGGPLAGVLAALLLATCPLYDGHMFINAKDGPFAVVMAIALLGLVRAFEEYPHVTPATIALVCIGLGLSIGSRVMGGFAVIYAVVPYLFIVGAEIRGRGLRVAAAEAGSVLYAFIPGLIVAYLVMGLAWPWSVVAPFNPFRAVDYFSSFFEKPWRELFDGQLILVPDMPRSYVPTLLAVKLPELMLVLGLGGLAGAMVTIVRKGIVGRRAALLAVTLAATLPAIVTIVVRPAMYNGIRHFVFMLPPFAVLGGLAGARTFARIERFGRIASAAAIAVLLLGLVSPSIDMIRIHPFEYTHFNRLAGGVRGANGRYMRDYWGLALTEASRELRAKLAARHETPPNGHWKLAVCGPHPPVKVALGPQYVTTWDPKGADFAMMLGEFYCARLDAPVLVDVVRDGVSYARVYDIRGRSFRTLLTMPGIDAD
jgi:MFS family permease